MDYKSGKQKFFAGSGKSFFARRLDNGSPPWYIMLTPRGVNFE